MTSAEGKITSTAISLTSLNSTVGTLSSTVQAQGNTLVDTNNKISSMYSIKVETNNGKKVGAGIVLGSDGDSSNIILYADRFSLFNRNSKTAVTPLTRGCQQLSACWSLKINCRYVRRIPGGIRGAGKERAISPPFHASVSQNSVSSNIS